MKQVFIVAACRTPVGRFLGSLKGFSAVDLGQRVVAEAVARAGLSAEQVDEVIFGNVLSAGLGQNPARQVTLGAGLPTSVGALTINKVCGSGLKSVALAAQGIQVSDIEVAVAGGMESMSNAPHLLMGAREGYRMGTARAIDSMIHDGLWDAYHGYHMGNTAEVVAKRYSVGQAEQDAYAAESHRRAAAATRRGLFKEEILPLEVLQKKGDPIHFDEDEGPRSDTSLESLARLRPVFQKKGTVTAGNASQISDGAAALVVMSEEAVRKSGCSPIARVVATATSGVDPEMVMMAPLGAIEKVLQRAGWRDDQVDLYEINEAFSVQAVALCEQIPLDELLSIGV